MAYNVIQIIKREENKTEQLNIISLHAWDRWIVGWVGGIKESKRVKIYMKGFKYERKYYFKRQKWATKKTIYWSDSSNFGGKNMVEEVSKYTYHINIEKRRRC